MGPDILEELISFLGNELANSSFYVGGKEVQTVTWGGRSMFVTFSDGTEAKLTAEDFVKK